MNENTVGRRTALAEQSARKQSEKMFETARMEDLAVLDKLGLRNKVEHLKNGIHTDVYSNFSENGFQPSGGEAQKIALARAYLRDSDIIILDEPTVGLDPKQITEIRSLIKELGKKHTVILSTHILSEVSQICEKVVIINKGKIVAVDTPENLEKATREKNGISITVEDPKGNINKLKEKIKEIDNIEFVKDNEDGTKQYLITTSTNIDLRKKLFEVLPKEEIVIFELKKTETTLEDAFIKLIDNSKIEQTETKNNEEKVSKKEKREKNDKKEEKK